jgi:hypothetical protein
MSRSLSMEEDVKKHDHPSPDDAVILASGVHTWRDSWLIPRVPHCRVGA